MTVDIEKLEALAKAATQGDWHHYRYGVIKGGPVVQFFNGSSQQQIAMTTGAEWMRSGEQDANADFIAAANPAVVLELITDSKQQAQQFKEWQASHHANYVAVADERDDLRAEVAGLKTGYEAYERVNAELRAECEALRKDADRYRWLRVKQTFIWLVQDWFPKENSLTDVDAEIDAAMSKEASHD